MMYVKNFTIGRDGGVSLSQIEFIRKEFVEEVQKLNKFKLVGPEAEDAIKLEQIRIEAEGGASMMCKAEECRRRLLKVASADLLVEGTVEKVGADTNEIRLDVHGRKVVATSDKGEKKEQSLNVFSVRYKVQKDEKESLRMLTLASRILAKKISGVRVSKEEEAQVSGLKPLGRDNLDYIARSAILPGWGQYQRGNYAKAFLFGGAFFASFLRFSAVYQDPANLKPEPNQNIFWYFGMISNFGFNQQALGVEPSQQTLILALSTKINSSIPYKNAIEEYNTSLSILGGVYALCLIDAYFSTSKYYLDRSEGLSFDFSLYPKITQHSTLSTPIVESNTQLQLNYRF